MTKLLKTYTFGSGFPTLPKRFPRTKVFDDYVIYFDHSARGPSVAMEWKNDYLIKLNIYNYEQINIDWFIENYK